MLLGGILLVAGLGKTISLVLDPYSTKQPALMLFLVMLELWVSTKLISTNSDARERNIGWLSAVGLGAIFASHWLFSGDNDCGCLGAFEIDYLPHVGLLGMYFVLLALSWPGWDGLKVVFSCPRGSVSGLLRTSVAAVLCFGGVYVFIVTPQGRAALSLGDTPIDFVNCARPNCGSLDLGVVDIGASKRCEVQITNRSEQVVRVVGHKLSCECTSLIECPKEIAPKEVARVSFTFVAKGEFGRKDARVTLYLGNAWQKSLNIRVTALAH